MTKSPKPIVRASVEIALAAVLVVVAALLALPQRAEAGVYSVRECDTPETGNLQPAAPDARWGGSFGTYFDGSNGCGFNGPINGIGIFTSGRSSAPGSYAAVDFVAPAGTRFVGGRADISFSNEGGYEPRLSVSDGSSHSMIHTQDTSGWQAFDWGPHFSFTNQMTLWMACVRGDGNFCQGQNANDYAFGRQFTFSVEDYTSPSSGSLGGSLVSGGWKSGTFAVDYSGSDGQAGVEFVELQINGNAASEWRAWTSCNHVGGGWYGRFQPCPSSGSISRSFNVSQGPFVQGANTVRGCVHDLATSGARNVSCSGLQTVNVDTVAPGAISSLRPLQGEDWRPTDDFDLAWTPPGGQVAPIAGAAYRITKVGGGYDSGRQYVAGASSGLELENKLPSNGHFQVKVWLRDEAGNETESSAVTTNLRLDETVPPDSAPRIANGWLSRDEFPYTQRWDRIDAAQLGPSGLAGYAVTVDRSPTSDPCVTAAHQTSDCASSEINQPGIANTERVLSDLDEGSHYVHVVAVTGAGRKQGEIEHTELKVDKTAPETSLAGVPDGWVNQQVTLSASTTDALSGMDPSGTDSGQPRTTILVDGQEFASTGAQAATTITSDGAHKVSYFARDLAGNVSEARGAVVRIDRTAPAIAFENAQASEEPERIRAPFTETLSGLASGLIEFRRQGAASWQPLETRIDDDALVARIPSEALDEDDYEFRATATDVAGNEARTTSRANGQPMSLRLPVKSVTNLRARIAGEATQATVPYGQRVTIAGSLRDGGQELGGERVIVRETYDPGSTQELREHAVSTNGQGEFSLELPAGPSREVRVVFEGTKRYTRAHSDELRLNVDGVVSVKLKRKRVRAGSAVRFSGRVASDGATMPPNGKLVEVQFFDHSKKRWRPIDRAMTTNAQGFFRTSYRFARFYAKKTKIKFRAYVLPENAWPYGPAASKSHRVIVRPAR